MKNKKIWIISIIVVSLLIHLTQYFLNKETYWNAGLLVNHANIALNILEGKGLSNNLQIREIIGTSQNADNRLYEPKDLDFSTVDWKTSYPAFERNPGYGVILAGIWRITGIYSYDAIRILQIILNVLFLFIIYKLFLCILKNERLAIAAMVIYTFCLPISFLASYPSEEIWGFWSVILALYFLISKISIRNFLLAGIILGIGSYIHEMPHILSKYLWFIAFLYIFYKLNQEILQVKIKYAAICVMAIYLIPILVLSPYIIRNYIEFNKYIETRYWGNHGNIAALGEFDENFARLNDGFVMNMATQKISSHHITGKNGKLLDITSPKYFDVLAPEYRKYLEEHPYVKIQNALKRIPKLLKSDQYWGIETLFNQKFLSWQLEKTKLEEATTANTSTYLKEVGVDSWVILKLFKKAHDVIIVLFLGGVILFYFTLKHRNPEIALLLSISILIYGGVLIGHVEAKYHLIPYVISFFSFYLCFYSLLKNKIKRIN